MYLIRNTSDKDTMNKKEFLDILRQSLIGEVNNSVIEQSINFYNEYISSQSDKSEKGVIDEIGDPRLIAKTIIESEKASYIETDNREKHNNRSYYNDNTREDDYRSSSNNKVYHLKWYHMAIISIILLFLFFLLIRIGWILLRLLFVFFVPIIFVVLLWVMFRKR